MKLKPMDKNTLNFLKRLVMAYEGQLIYAAEGALENEHFKGFHVATRHWLCVAITLVSDYDGEEFDLIIPAFMEAVKNADTNR